MIVYIIIILLLLLFIIILLLLLFVFMLFFFKCMFMVDIYRTSSWALLYKPTFTSRGGTTLWVM